MHPQRISDQIKNTPGSDHGVFFTLGSNKVV
jgi:hypothetical protein